MEKKIFISHSHKDTSVAVMIRDALENNGIGCWICSRDIKSGEIWDAEIVSAIESCEVFLFLLSENSAGSKQCDKEIALADAASCRMICMNIDRCELVGSAKYHFINSQMLFADRINMLNELEGVVGRIRGFVNGDSFDSAVKTVSSYSFEFELDLKNKVAPLSIEQKAQLVEIITESDRELDISIKFDDKNMEALEEQYLQIKNRIADGEDVSDKEIHYMKQLRTVCERRKLENLWKSMAAKLFLADKNTKTACQLYGWSEVWEVLKAILEYQFYFDIQEKANSPEYYMLEFFLKKEKLYFSAPVRKEIIEERRAAMGYFCEIEQLPAADLGVQYLKEILQYFYIYLAQEIIDGNEQMQNQRVRDLMNYYFGFK